MNRKLFVAACILPAMILLIVLALAPTIGAINLSFQDRSLRFPDGIYIGFENYQRLLHDRRFLGALKTSVIWEIATVAGTMIGAAGVATLLYEKTRGQGRNLICLVLLLPILLPRVSAGLIWRFMLSPSMGLINYPLTGMGLPPVDFLANPSLALWAVAFVDIWQWAPFFAVILLKLMETLPKSPLEAARIDHAKPWEIHWFVVLPMLRGPLIMLGFVKAVESLRSFDLIYTMTNGGPGTSTETLDLYAYNQGIGISGETSYAAAMSVLLMVLTIVVFSIIWNRMRQWSD
ncbi:sugar ABC transporter permease [Martelella mediterranea]|uniref:carbohydrate ABC transporter permease n=1 Tax=Martelella mediterranea TaxID=293089 RepID=UPI001E43FADC|nr:sugar ABC transporter permease [Martelella mediterranea]MCD1635789.1 sugar ABC transporter permease [Martelella mediterranea]